MHLAVRPEGSDALQDQYLLFMLEQPLGVAAETIRRPPSLPATNGTLRKETKRDRPISQRL
jgi:hypothetical protein